MMTKITIELPEGTLSTLRTSPEEFGRQMRLAAAVKWYELGRISQGKAAELAGMSRAAFISALRDYGVSAIQTPQEAIDEELRSALNGGEDNT